MSTGVKNEQIIKISLDDIQNLKYRNPIELDKYLRDHIEDSNLQYYIFIDEIQFVKEIKNPFFEEDDSKITFVDVLIGLMKIQNLDIYVTGSNSKMLSKDVLTQFRDRGDEIKVYPFSFSEFYSCYEGEKNNAFSDYCIYGGMPRSVVELKSHNQKSEYLKGIFETTYLKDIIERYSISNDKIVISSLLDIISSYIGSLTNPSKLEKTFKSEKNITISQYLISNYISYFEEAFLIEKAQRYDVKRKKYISTPYKYYFSDLGLRNARLNFRQNEITHIMENVIYNELRMRGYNVDVGVVVYNTKDSNGKSLRMQLEVDFIINIGSNRYYIQSALNVDTKEKRLQETESLRRTGDSFKKIVIVKDNIMPIHDENGILYIGVENFLLDESLIDF